jgi:hypothetical protein
MYLEEEQGRFILDDNHEAGPECDLESALTTPKALISL